MIRRIFKNAFFTLTARFLSSFSNLVILLAVARGTNKDTLGIYAIATFLYYGFAFFSSFELTAYFARESAILQKNREKLSALTAEAGVTFWLGTLAGIIVVAGLLLVFHRVSHILLLTTAAAGLLLGMEKNLSGFMLGMEKMPLEGTAQFFGFLFTGVPALLWIDRLGISGIFVLRFLVSLAGILLRLWGGRLSLKPWPTRSAWHLYPLREIRFFALPGLSLLIYYHLDLFILSLLIDPAALGTYFLASRIYLAFSLLAETTAFSLVPFLTRTHRSYGKKDFQSFYRQLFRIVSILGIMAALLLFFTRHLLVNVFSSGGGDPVASEYLGWFSLMLLFRFISFFSGDTLTSIGRQKVRFQLLVATSAILLLLQVGLGQRQGVPGIIVAKTIAEIVLFIAYGAALHYFRPGLGEGIAEKA